ncbi:MAG: hypothetical protein ACFB50_15140 [Rubrobacteraceae bacterium]
MKRIFLAFTVTMLPTPMVTFPGLAFAQGGHASCKAFGQSIAGLATTLGGTFGQPAAAGAPLNDTVETEQASLCEPW